MHNDVLETEPKVKDIPASKFEESYNQLVYYLPQIEIICKYDILLLKGQLEDACIFLLW